MVKPEDVRSAWDSYCSECGETNYKSLPKGSPERVFLDMLEDHLGQRAFELLLEGRAEGEEVETLAGLMLISFMVGGKIADKERMPDV